LADTKTNPLEELALEILIGGESYWKIVKNTSPISISEFLVLIPSIFDWILSGNRFEARVNSTKVNLFPPTSLICPQTKNYGASGT
jgi:hypothetical protein